jgi:hypothetical protein
MKEEKGAQLHLMHPPPPLPCRVWLKPSWVWHLLWLILHASTSCCSPFPGKFNNTTRCFFPNKTTGCLQDKATRAQCLLGYSNNDAHHIQLNEVQLREVKHT